MRASTFPLALVTLLAMLGAGACAPVLAPPRVPLEELQALGAASTCSASSQCRSIAIGAKACGGPEGYLAVSQVHAERAQVLARRHAARRGAENAAEPGAASNCMVVSDPGATCQAGLCVLGSGGDGGLRATR